MSCCVLCWARLSASATLRSSQVGHRQGTFAVAVPVSMSSLPSSSPRIPRVLASSRKSSALGTAVAQPMGSTQNTPPAVGAKGPVSIPQPLSSQYKCPISWNLAYTERGEGFPCAGWHCKLPLSPSGSQLHHALQRPGLPCWCCSCHAGDG